MDNFIFLRSDGYREATVRLHSEPLRRALRDIKESPVRTVSSGSSIESNENSWIIYHYDDIDSFEFLIQNYKNINSKGIICLACDIYKYEHYYKHLEICSFFLCPTEQHTKAMSSRFYTPAYTLGEGIDPISLADIEDNAANVEKSFCWFGYPESFSKSMSSILPVIDYHIDIGTISNFEIISRSGSINNFGYKVFDFDEHVFRRRMNDYSYTILSHFALDLHANSMIKTSNKAVTAIFTNTVPIVSDTISYRKLYENIGLERFIFSSAMDLDRILMKLNPEQDLAEIINAKKILIGLFSDRIILDNFEAALNSYPLDNAALARLNLPKIETVAKFPSNAIKYFRKILSI